MKSDPQKKVCQLAELPSALLAALLAARPIDNASVQEMIAGESAAIDWPAVAADAGKHALSVLVYQRLQELDCISLVNTAVVRAWEADAHHARLQHILQERDAFLISQVLAECGVRHAFVKGFAYRQWLYQPPWVRLGGDVDLLIDHQNTEVARLVMQELGFTQSAGTLDYQQFRPATPWEIQQTESQHYELAQFVKSVRLTNPPDWLLGPAFVRRVPFTYEYLAQGPVHYSVVDIHWALHFALARESPLEDLCVFPTAGGVEIPVLSPEWSIFTTSFKLYYEAFDRPYYGLHHLVDLAALLQSASPGIDWSFLCQLVGRYGFEAAAFYTLSAADRLTSQKCVPAEILQEWSQLPTIETQDIASADSSANRELGDFLPHMLGRRTPGQFPISR